MAKEWNFSKLATLRQCHRKFFFGFEIARHEFTHPYRRKAFELAKVKTLKMWQGSVIDHAVTNLILPCYNAKTPPDFGKIANDAVALAKRQFNYSSNRYYHRNDISRKEVGNDFLVLDIHEFNTPCGNEVINEVYETINSIILSFPNYASPEAGKNLHDYLMESSFLRPDVRNLGYTYGDIKIKPQIDLVRYKGKSIHVIDWKVSERDDSDYSRQLILGGIVTLHYGRNTFKIKEWKPVPDLSSVKLLEINLMNGSTKEHPFTKESTAAALDYVSSYGDEQEQLSQLKAWNELEVNDYVRTNKTETCSICKFKPLCKHLLMNNSEYDEAKYYQLVQNNELARPVF